MIKIPTRSDLGNYTERIELDGSVYIFEFRWNDRFEQWVMDISDEQETPLVSGVVLFVGFELLHGLVSESLPPGRFIVLHDTEDSYEMKEEDLGDTVNLYYEEAS